MDNSELGDGVGILQRRATNAKVAIYASLVGWAGMLVANLIESAGTADLNAEDPDTLTSLVGLIYVANFVAFVASVVVVALWIHRAHRNLSDGGIVGLQFTPGWSVGMVLRSLRQFGHALQGDARTVE